MTTNKSRSFKKTRNYLDMTVPEFVPLKEAQVHAKVDYDDGKHLLLCGYAGTGKSHLALAFGLESLSKGTKQNIHIFRSAVQGRDMGFMPGTEEEKMAVYEPVYRRLVNKIMDRGDAYEILKSKRTISFNSTSFLRGLTFDNSVIIVDECQNMDDGEINTLMTRLGDNCQVILCGDFRQTDLPHTQSGFRLLHKVFSKIKKYTSIIEFEISDIVRDDFVKEWIVAVESIKNESQAT